MSASTPDVTMLAGSAGQGAAARPEAIADVAIPRAMLADICARLELSTIGSRPVLIGILGHGGSGKTTLTEALRVHIQRYLPELTLGVLHTDCYISQPRTKKNEMLRTMRHFSEYWQLFAVDALVEDLDLLAAGRSVVRKGLYSRASGNLDLVQITDIESARPRHGPVVVLAEGLMLVHPKLVQRFHRIVALDLDPEICLERKIERAGSYRSPEKTTRLFQDFERPMVADQWERILHLERTFHLRQKKHGELIF